MRIGGEQALPDESIFSSPLIELIRTSKDPITNARGRRFVEFCDENDLVILNRRCRRDNLGHFTYIASQGCSVNDLCCVPINLICLLNEFRIIPESFSDHLPISRSVVGKQPEKNLMPLIPQLKWNNGFADSYRSRLEITVNNISVSADNPEFALPWLMNAIR